MLSFLDMNSPHIAAKSFETGFANDQISILEDGSAVSSPGYPTPHSRRTVIFIGSLLACTHVKTVLRTDCDICSRWIHRGILIISMKMMS